VTIRKFWK